MNIEHTSDTYMCQQDYYIKNQQKKQGVPLQNKGFLNFYLPYLTLSSGKLGKKSSVNMKA